MSARLMVGICALSAAGFLGACGKAEGGGEPIAKQDLPERFGSVFCKSIGSCCQQGGYPFDMAGCKQRYAAQISEFLAEENGRVVYDPQAAGQCLAAAEGQLVCGRSEGADIPACERVFRGTVAVGDTCNESEECAPAASGQRVYCEYQDDISAPRVCTLLEETVARRGKAGEACNATCSGNGCSGVSVPAPGGPGVPMPVEPVTCYRDDGLYCNFTTGVCEPPAAVGQPCSDFDSCVENAFCDFGTGSCAAPRANGQPCQGSDECQSGSCMEQQNPDGSFQGVCGAEMIDAEACAEISNPEPEPQLEEPQPVGDPAPTDPGTM